MSFAGEIGLISLASFCPAQTVVFAEPERPLLMPIPVPNRPIPSITSWQTAVRLDTKKHPPRHCSIGEGPPNLNFNMDQVANGH